MSPRGVAAIVTLVALLHAVSFAGMGPVDDDFIVYRYARNWVDGLGLVYNTGERVEGFTVPLWVMLVAAGMLLRIPPELFSVGVGLASVAGTVWLLARAGDGTRRRDPPVAALLLACSPAFAFHAVAGLGTTLLALLLTYWFVSALRSARDEKSPVPAALALGLASLLRAEAVLFALPWIVFSARRRHGWASALSLGPVAAWSLFRAGYYGRVLPVTYEVKKLPVAADLSYGLDYLIYSTAQTGIAFLVALALVAATRERTGAAVLLRAATLGLVLHTAYVVYVGGDYLELARFHVPVLPLALWLGCRGAATLVPRRRIVAIGLTIAACVLPQWSQSARADLRRSATDHRRWRAVGEHLSLVLPPGASVALSPIGIIGYVSALHVVDLLGVTNTAVLEADPDLSIQLKGHHRHRGSWAVAQEPDIVLLGNAVCDVDAAGHVVPVALPWERSVWQSPGFERDYAKRVMPIPGSEPLIFFQHRGAPELPGAQPVD